MSEPSGFEPSAVSNCPNCGEAATGPHCLVCGTPTEAPNPVGTGSSQSGAVARAVATDPVDGGRVATGIDTRWLIWPGAVAAVALTVIGILSFTDMVAGFPSLSRSPTALIPVAALLSSGVAGVLLLRAGQSVGLGLTAGAGLVGVAAVAGRSPALFDGIDIVPSVAWVVLPVAAVACGRVVLGQPREDPEVPLAVAVFAVVALSVGLWSLVAPVGSGWGVAEHLFGSSAGDTVRGLAVLVPVLVSAVAVVVSRRFPALVMASGVGLAYALGAALSAADRPGVLAGAIPFPMPELSVMAFGSLGLVSGLGAFFAVGDGAILSWPPHSRVVASAMCIVGAVTIGVGVPITVVSDDHRPVDDVAAFKAGEIPGEDVRDRLNGALLAEPTIDRGLSVLTEPAKAWEFPAMEVAPDARIGGLTPAEEGVVDAPFVLSVDDVVVGRANGTVFAVDATSGGLLWTDAALLTCWSLLERTLLLCQQDDGFSLVDHSSGEILGRALFESMHVMAAAHAHHDTVYALAPHEDFFRFEDGSQAFTLKALSADDLTERWSTTVTLGGDRHQHLAPFGVHASTSTVAVSRWVHAEGDPTGAGGHHGVWVLDPRDGEEMTFVDVGVSGGVDDGIVIATRRDGDGRDGASVTTQLRDLNGNSLLVAPGEPWPSVRPDAGFLRGGRIGLGQALYDVTSGREIWASDRLGSSGDSRRGTWGYGDNQVWEMSSSADELRVVDAEDGRPFGDAFDVATLGWVLTGTADAVVILDDRDLEVRVVGLDGVPEWSRPWAVVADAFTDSQGHIHAYGHVVVTDTAIVVAGENGLIGFTGFGRSPGGPAGTDRVEIDGADPELVTPCGAEPELVATEAEAAGGGVTVTFEVRATCPGGQWLAADRQIVSVTATAPEDPPTGAQGRLAAEGSLLLSGLFDFSRDPVWIPDHGADLRLVFPQRTVYSSLDEIRLGIASRALSVICDPDEDAVQGAVPTDTNLSADPERPRSATGPAHTTEVGEESALDALRRIAAADDHRVRSSLADNWLVQLSSKVEGTRDDGITYTYEDILEEHLRLRLRYENVRLVNSAEWANFHLDGYWVTLVGVTHDHWRPPLEFCAAEGFSRDHCYAKFLADHGPPEGTVRFIESLDEDE